MSVEDLPGEEWRPIVGFEGTFEVSSLGRVKSLPRTITERNGRRRRVPGGLRKLHLNTTGYPAINLRRPDGTQRTRSVHVLMALAFLGPRPPGYVACHNDGDKLNCVIENIRWDTYSANSLDAVRHGVQNNARKTHCLNGHPFEGDNVRHYKRGRICRTCEREREYRRKGRVAA